MLAENNIAENDQGGGTTLFILLIDGPSGVGKSTLARALLGKYHHGVDHNIEQAKLFPPEPQTLGATLIRLDDMYPGWGGLKATSTSLVTDILEPLRNGRAGTWTRWDWITSRPAETHTVSPTGILIIEGCGAITHDSRPLADCRLWLGTDDPVRKRRALARGGEDFDAHWDQWQRQFDQHVARNHPDKIADFCIDSTRDIPVEAVQTHLTQVHGLPD